MEDRADGGPAPRRRAGTVVVVAGKRGVAAIDPARLVAARKRAKLSQAALAARLGASQYLIARWEGGKGRPSVDQIPRIAAALDVDDVLDLLRDEAPHSVEVLRIAAGLTQETLVDRLRDEHGVVMSRQRWRKIEQGSRPVPEHELSAVAQVLGASTQQVLRAEVGDNIDDVIVLTPEQIEALDADRLPGESRADALDRKLRG